VYVGAYTFGRFWVESLRIDSANKFWGLRLNDWTSIVVFVIASALVVRGLRGATDTAADTAVDPADTAVDPADTGVDPAEATVPTGDSEGR
jgi:hypothetical protein